MPEKLCGFLIGHSFIKHLVKNIPVTRQDTRPQSLAKYFKVDDFITSLYSIGVSGAHANENQFNAFFSSIKVITPDFVILELGCNDLDSNVLPLSVSSKLVDFAKKLLDHNLTKHVLIYSVLPREKSRYYLSNEKLKTVIDSHNRYLYHFCLVEPNITYFKHKGFNNFGLPREFTTDGIHPICCKGSTYWRSVRRSLFLAVSTLHQSATRYGLDIWLMSYTVSLAALIYYTR